MQGTPRNAAHHTTAIGNHNLSNSLPQSAIFVRLILFTHTMQASLGAEDECLDG
jgi:hypothetical protein